MNKVQSVKCIEINSTPLWNIIGLFNGKMQESKIHTYELEHIVNKEH
jgi:hypothetical protein